MKFDLRNKWHQAALVIVVNAVVTCAAIAILFHTNLGAGMPDGVKIYGPVLLYLITCWFLILHRPR